MRFEDLSQRDIELTFDRSEIKKLRSRPSLPYFEPLI